MCHPALSCAVLPCRLSDNKIKGSGEALGGALKVNSSLEELYMVDCGLGPEDARGLAGGIAVHASLTELDVRLNDLIGSEGEAALQDAVRSKKGFELLLI